MGLDEITAAQKRGEARGMTSVCSANPWVLKAAMRRAVKSGASLLIESTCNQVNQFGGYTGLTPAGFAAYVRAKAHENGLDERQILLGGDHLGPNPDLANDSGVTIRTKKPLPVAGEGSDSL